MSKKLDGHFPKMLFVPASIVFNVKTLDEKAKTFDGEPKTFDGLSFWH